MITKIGLSFHNYRGITNSAIVLAKKSFLLRNEGSLLGIFWYLLNPLVIFLVLLHIKQYVIVEVPNYPMYLFIGLVIFNFIKKCTVLIANSFVGNASFIKNTDLNNFILPLHRLFETIFSHFFEILIFIFMMIYYHINILNIFLYLFFLIFISLFAFSIGLILAIIRIFVVDLLDIWGIVMQILWFLTPIFYIATNSSSINLFNPFYYFIEASRIIIFGEGNILIVIFATVISLISALGSGLIYCKIKHHIAEFV